MRSGTCFAPHLPAVSTVGRPRAHGYRAILDAIFSIVRSGCAWRLLPRDFPPWKTVYHYFRRWRLDGRWERLHTALREAVRVREGRQAHPSAGIVDSQSVKTKSIGGVRGYDGGEKVSGREWHLFVDTQGWILRAVVRAANVLDRDGIAFLLGQREDRQPVHVQLPCLRHLWLDAGYNGKGAGADWVRTTLGWNVAVVQHPPRPRAVWAPAGAVIDWDAILPLPGFRVLPRRWVVEPGTLWVHSSGWDKIGAWQRSTSDAARRVRRSSMRP